MSAGVVSVVTIFLNAAQFLEGYLAAHDVRDLAVWGALGRALGQRREPTLVARTLDLGRRAARALVPLRLRSRLSVARGRNSVSPGVGRVRFGDLRRLQPLSREFGYDRGLPVDRHYIEGFLAGHANDVRGRVLEIGDDAYTRRFGGPRVTRRDVLHVNPVEGATFVGDLTRADGIPSDAFDCVILTQTLHLIYDVRAALATVHRILKPGGRLLATAPGISQIGGDQWREYWCWSFTSRSLRQLLNEAFPGGEVAVVAHGNVLAAIAFLHGLAAEELRRGELAHNDPAYEVLLAARARKTEAVP
jgi:SAM-dependent methyltransferase